MPLRPSRLTPLFLPLSPETHALLKHGAKYHGISVKVYARWLLDLALQDEVKYYGWATQEVVADATEATDTPEALSDD